MKFKFLTLAVLAMLFTACKPEPDDGDETNPNNGDGEKSYISLTLTSGDGGSKGIADYNDGTAEEVAVSKAYVFFFKNGEGFAPATGTANNWKELTFADPEDDNWTEEGTDPNVSDISEKVMAINNYNGELPNQMVVVLNWTPTSPTYSLTELREALVSHVQEFDSKDYFVMSNSVYQGSSGPVYATPLAITDFKTSDTEAVGSPIKVYVERVAAKVVLTTDKANNYSTLPDYMFPLLKTKAGSTQIEIEGTPIYAKILDWELYNDYEQSTIIKNIDGLNPSVPYSWNDISHFRSTWAATSGTWAEYNDPDDEFFTWGTPSSYTTTGHYCGENTRGNDVANAAQRTKIIIKAQLTNAAGTAAYDVARWFGHHYIKEADLLSAVSNTVASKYYYIDGGVYKSISADDLMTVAGLDNGNPNEPKKYQVYFKLNTADGLGENKTWYIPKTDGTGYEVVDNATINDYLKENIAPALVYKGGRTYFFTDVEHLNDTYGVVRNHYYDVNIKSISGLGTPVPDASAELDPELPIGDESTYLATEINILSWNVVSSDIDL
ncbi:MAG: Mfa1 fimbrilin C-terminal domain-containing protein [Bacteroidales bacterium]|nr:Mfa1 fimbrilin C-terminal domain-containing protein [Bacteroidales bacterium]